MWSATRKCTLLAIAGMSMFNATGSEVLAAQVVGIGEQGSDQRETLEHHLRTFIERNAMEQLAFEVGAVDPLTTGTDQLAVAREFVERLAYLEVGDQGFPIALRTLEGPSEDAEAFAESLLPHVVSGGSVVDVHWYLGETRATTVALVKPGATVGDLYAIVEPVTAFFRREEIHAPASYHRTFRDGFGMIAAQYFCDARISCAADGTYLATGVVEAYDRGPLCSAISSKHLEQTANCCVNECRFVGFCGWPAIRVEYGDAFAVQLGAFTWTYFTSAPDIGPICTECDARRR